MPAANPSSATPVDRATAATAGTPAGRLVAAVSPTRPAGADRSGAGPPVTIETTSERWPVVRVAGRALHSRRDPVAEAERWAEAVVTEIGPAPGDVLVVFGCGWGWHATAIARRWPGALFVREPFAALRPSSVKIPARPWGDGPAPFQSLDSAHDEVTLGHAVQDGGTVHFASLPVYARLLPEGRDRLRGRVERLVAEVALYRETTRRRAAEWADHAFANACWLPESHPVSHFDDAARGLPAFLVAAGPSLDRNVKLLRQATARGIVIAVNHALGALHRAGVVPDLVVGVEGRDVSGHFAVPPAYFSRLLLGTMAHPALFRLPCDLRFVGHIAEDPVAGALMNALGDDGRLAAGGSAATLAFGIAARMGADPIVLVGQDLAFTDQRGYATGARRDDMRLASGPDGSSRLVRRSDEMDLPGQGGRIIDAVALRDVPAWGGGLVPTSPALDAQRTWLERAIAGLGGEQRVINATEGGALLEGAEHVPLAGVLARLVDAGDVDERKRRALDPPPRDESARRKALRRFAVARRRRLQTALGLLRSGLRQLRRLEATPSAERDALLAAFARTDRAVGKAIRPFAELDAYLAAGDPPLPAWPLPTKEGDIRRSTGGSAHAAVGERAEVGARGSTAELAGLRRTYARVEEAGRCLCDRYRTLEASRARK